MATLRPPAPAVKAWEEGGPGPPPRAQPRPKDDEGDHRPTNNTPPSSASASASASARTTKGASPVDDAAAELMSYLDATSSALSASARTAEREASEARENARAAMQIAQNYSSSGKSNHNPSPGMMPIVSGGDAAPPSSPGGKKRKNPLLATVSPVPLVGVGAPPAGVAGSTRTTGASGTAKFVPHPPPPPRPPMSAAVGKTSAGRPTSAQITTPVGGATATHQPSPSSTSRLAQSHAEDVLSLALEVETLRSQLESERQSHDRTRSLLATEKARSQEFEDDLRSATKELESTVERNRREVERRSRELENAVARTVAAEEDAALALDLAKAANEGREQMESWLNAAMEEIERLKGGGGGGGGGEVPGATTGEEALLAAAAADRVRHEIEVEQEVGEGGRHEHERGAHPYNPGELLKRDSSIFHPSTSSPGERRQRGNDVGGRVPEATIFDPAAMTASASARAAIPEHDGDEDGEEEEDVSSSYGVGGYDAPTDASLAGDMADDADASLTTVGTNPSLGGTPGAGAGADGGFGGFRQAYVFATDGGDDGDDDGDDEGGGDDDEVEREEEDDDVGDGDAPASDAPAMASVTTPPAGNSNNDAEQPRERTGGGASRAMVAVGRDLLLRRTAATASGNAAGDPASRSPSAMAYRVSLAKIAERRTRLHERLNRAGAAADVELEGVGRRSPSIGGAGATATSPGEYANQKRGVDLGRHRIYLTSASADRVLELLRDSGRRLKLGRNFVLTDNVGDVGGGFFGSGEDDLGGGGGHSPSGGDGAAVDEEDERMETGRSTLSNIEGIAANYCRAVEAKVNLQREECRQLESLCEYLERKVVESDFGQDLA